MSIKVRYPNDEKAEQAIERDRKYWSKVYSHNAPGICPDTKDHLKLSVCEGCEFKRRIEGADVHCALARGNGWIKN